MKNLRLILVSILVSVAGFQTGQPVQAAATDNGSFMSLWSTYSHCQATTGIDQLREDALTLTNAANRSLTQEGFVLPLPGKLEKFVSTPSSPICCGRESNGCSLFLAGRLRCRGNRKTRRCQRPSPDSPELPAPIRVCLLRPAGERLCFQNSRRTSLRLRSTSLAGCCKSPPAGQGAARCPSCSQNAHDKTVLVQCAQ